MERKNIRLLSKNLHFTAYFARDQSKAGKDNNIFMKI